MAYKIKQHKTWEEREKIYGFRRRIMNHLYKARNLSGERLPYLKVRIIPLEKNILGQIHFDKKQNIMYISEDMENWNDLRLKYIVYHELGHAYFKAKHTEKNKLMNKTYRKEATEQEIEKDFVELAKQSKEKII